MAYKFLLFPEGSLLDSVERESSRLSLELQLVSENTALLLHALQLLLLMKSMQYQYIVVGFSLVETTV